MACAVTDAFAVCVYLLLTSSHLSSILSEVGERGDPYLNYTFHSLNWIDVFPGPSSWILGVHRAEENQG